MVAAAVPLVALLGDERLGQAEVLGQLRQLRGLQHVRVLLQRYVRFLGVVLQRAEDRVVRQLHADAVELAAQIAHVSRHVVADDQAAIREIPVDLVGVIDEFVLWHFFIWYAR